MDINFKKIQNLLQYLAFYIKITFIMDLAIKKIYHSIDTTFTIMKIN